MLVGVLYWSGADGVSLPNGKLGIVSSVLMGWFGYANGLLPGNIRLFKSGSWPCRTPGVPDSSGAGVAADDDL